MSETKAVPLSETLLALKHHIIDDVKVSEDEEGLHVEISSRQPSELEPENICAITYSYISFLIPARGLERGCVDSYGSDWRS